MVGEATNEFVIQPLQLSQQSKSGTQMLWLSFSDLTSHYISASNVLHLYIHLFHLQFSPGSPSSATIGSGSDL